MPLDEFLPEFHFNEVHSTRVAAPPERVLAAARAVTPREVRLLVALMAIRSLPSRLRGERRLSTDRPILDQFLAAGFTLLAERPDELVAGGAGRFWTPAGGVRPVGRDEFAAFGEPGFAKAVMSFQVRAAGDGTVLTTETRIQATDEHARRSFGRYWRLIRPGSGAIRLAWLRAIRKRAEGVRPHI